MDNPDMGMDVLNLEYSEDKELVTELTKHRKDAFDKALTAAITGVTPSEDFPNNKIPTRKMRGGGKDAQYIPGWWFIQMANGLFHHMWSSEVTSFEVNDKTRMVWVQGFVTVNIPGRTIIKRNVDGIIVNETRIDSMTIKHSQFGSSDMKRKADDSGFVDVGDDLKSAATDMKKKCLTNFGFGADIYGKREDQDSISASKNIIIVFKRGAQRKMDAIQVEDFCVEAMSKPLTDLSEKEIMDFLGKIDKVEIPE